MEYTGLLATLNNFDEDFAIDTIAKLLENVMRNENSKYNRRSK